MESHLLTGRVGLGSGGLIHVPGHSQHTECPALLPFCHQKMKPRCLPTTMSQSNRMWPAGTKLISQEIQSCHEHSFMFLCQSSACCCVDSTHSDMTEVDMNYLSHRPTPTMGMETQSSATSCHELALLDMRAFPNFPKQELPHHGLVR